MFHHEQRIPVRVGSEGADIFFFGDEQEGSDGYRDDAWQAFKEDWKRSKNPWGIHMGDARDWLRPSMRGRLEEVMTKDPSMKKQMDDLVMGGVEKTVERLEFMKGRIIGMHEGHHDYEFQSGANATMMLATALNTVNMGWVATTRLILSREADRLRRKDDGLAFTIASTHGNASGRNTTAVAQSMENSVKDYVCDLKVAGHACRSASWTPHTYKIVRRHGPPGVQEIIPRHLLVGGFCDAYTDGWISKPIPTREGKLIGGRPKRSYAEGRNLTSQPLMWGVARIRLRAIKARAEAESVNQRNLYADVEVVNRGPGIDQNGLYR